MRIRILFLILMIFPLLLSAQKDNGNIYGKIIDDQGHSLELVNIAVVGTSLGSSSDNRGYYTLDIPADTLLEIAFSFIGYQQEKKTVKLKAGERRKIDVELKSISTTLPDAIVSDRQINSASITRLDAREISLIPSSSTGGVEDLVKTLPGVSSTNELSSQYNVRGGNFDENLIYINGIEIYKPFLVGSGQQEGLSIINPKLVSNIDFSAGGFSAEYGDKLSSALDITYKKPLIPAASLSLSLLGAEAHVEGTTGHKMSYLIGARYKNNKYILGKMETKGTYQPNFTDVQGIITYNVNPKFEISAFGYYSRNSYHMIPETRQTDFGNIQLSHRITIYFDGKESSNYNTGLGAVTFNYSPNEDLNLKLIASTYSAVESENYDIQGQYYIGQLETNPGSEQAGNVISNQGVGTFIEHARNDFFSQVFNITSVRKSCKADFNISCPLTLYCIFSAVGKVCRILIFGENQHRLSTSETLSIGKKCINIILVNVHKGLDKLPVCYNHKFNMIKLVAHYNVGTYSEALLFLAQILSRNLCPDRLATHLILHES